MRPLARIRGDAPVIIGVDVTSFLLYDGASGADIARQVRTHISDIIRQRELAAEIAADLALAATELINNAANAGARRIGVTLATPPPDMRLNVSDDAPGEPLVGPVEMEAVHGRGLHIIAALADDWGCTAAGTDGRKTVWALFRIGSSS
jgi:hypothetical protein